MKSKTFKDEVYVAVSIPEDGGEPMFLSRYNGEVAMMDGKTTTGTIFDTLTIDGSDARQKALLMASGHEVDVRNLLSEAWTPEMLRAFFGTRPVSAWFNPSAARIKSGEIDPHSIAASKALALMIEDPRLIRRPLLQVGARRETGFEQDQVDIWIGLSSTRERVDETYLKSGAGA